MSSHEEAFVHEGMYLCPMVNKQPWVCKETEPPPKFDLVEEKKTCEEAQNEIKTI